MLRFCWLFDKHQPLFGQFHHTKTKQSQVKCVMAAVVVAKYLFRHCKCTFGYGGVYVCAWQ